MDLEYSYQRYLASKKYIDDLSLNQRVLGALSAELNVRNTERPFKTIEIGAGVGTMIERLLEAELMPSGEYEAFDISRKNIEEAKKRIIAFAKKHDYVIENLAPYEVFLKKGSFSMTLKLYDQDAVQIIKSQEKSESTDLVIAQAVLDLLNVEEALASIFATLKPGGLLYSSINFDGVTYFGPTIDHEFDAFIEEQYHQTMFDSKTGRNLLSRFVDSEGEILSVGSSDWVIYPPALGYDADTQYFLHYIINTVHEALIGKPKVDKQQLELWIKERHEQVNSHKLLYIAHQFDYLVKRS
ncbi:MAG: class I SAM-dependent methyltransferase [Chloroflexota bacterium]|nr:class I SAM-dependent methyltransferase [Chloroflexota bacterium]